MTKIIFLSKLSGKRRNVSIYTTSFAAKLPYSDNGETMNVNAVFMKISFMPTQILYGAIIELYLNIGMGMDECT